MALNLASILHNATKTNASETAVIFNEHRMSYAELNGAAKKCANMLVQLGIKPGDRVGLMLPNVPWFPICYYGILYTGAVVVPFNVLFVGDEVAYQLEDSGCVAFIVWDGFKDAALDGFRRQEETCRSLIGVSAAPGTDLPEPMRDFHALMAPEKPEFDMAQTMPDDTAVILYTSGTTGRAKGAMLTHFNMYYNAELSATSVFSENDLHIRLGSGDVGLVALPLFHIYGQTCLMNALLFAGAAMTLLPRFTAEDTLRIIERDNVTFFAGVPTMYFALLQCPDREKYDISSLRLCAAGGAATPVDVLHNFQDRYGLRILEGYGLSETSPVACSNSLDFPTKPGSIGKPIYGVDMQVFDDNDNEVPDGEPGEIVIRGHLIMKGYLNRPQATKEAMRNGWFHTGDIGKRDEEGYFFILDRKKELIIRGGFNVYPREVEEVLYAHPDIIEAAVIGVPDEKYGEEVKAVIALKPGATRTVEEIQAYCKEHIAANKYPRIIEIIETLPKGPTGKILKRLLKGDTE